MSGLTAVFWAIWLVFKGHIPEINCIKITSEYAINLPFEMSRWWDILLGPVYGVIFVIANKINDDDDLFIVSFVITLVVTAFLAWTTPLTIIALLTAGIIISLLVNYETSLGIGLVFALLIGLINGLLAGIATILIFAIIVCVEMPSKKSTN
jgi:hypothetical protein